MNGEKLSGCGLYVDLPSRVPNFRRVPLFIVLPVLAGRPLLAQACGPEVLRLEERAVQALPPQFGVEGASALPGGGYAIWTAEGSIYAIYPDGIRERRVLPMRVHPVGLAADSAGYRFLDRDTGIEYLLGGDSLPIAVGRVPLAAGEELEGAERMAEGWVVALRDVTSRRFRLRRVGAAGTMPLFDSPPSDSAGTIPRYHLAAHGEVHFLTRLTAPFEVLRLTPAGVTDTLLLPLAEPELRRALGDSLSGWRALPLVPLDCGYLLTLSDLTSDRRLLVRLDPSGRLARVTALDAPFGVMAGQVEAATLLAARRAGALELVWYGWRWVRELP